MYLFTSLIQFRGCLSWHPLEAGAGEKGKYTWCPPAPGQDIAHRNPPAFHDPNTTYSYSSSGCPLSLSVLLALGKAGGDQQLPPRNRVIRPGLLPHPALALQGRELRQTQIENHCSKRMPCLIRNFPRNKKRMIPGKEVTFISALEAAQAHRPQGQHFGQFWGTFCCEVEIKKNKFARSDLLLSFLRLVFPRPSVPSTSSDLLSHLPFPVVQAPPVPKVFSPGLQVRRWQEVALLGGEQGGKQGVSHWPPGESINALHLWGQLPPNPYMSFVLKSFLTSTSF